MSKMPSINKLIKKTLAQKQMFVRKYRHLGRGVDLAVDIKSTFDAGSFDVVLMWVQMLANLPVNL